MSLVATAIIGGIGFVWKQLSGAIKAIYSELSRRNDVCDEDRGELREKLDAVERDMDVFKTCGIPDCGAKAAFQRRATFSLHKNTPP